MDDFDDGVWPLPEDVRVIAGAFWQMPALTRRSVPYSVDASATYAATACRSSLVKPASRLIFTPWVFGNAMRTAMHA